MPLSLTCDCGARFEVEESLAGQSVSCPECQQTLKAPAAQRPVVRTSHFALASFLLAIVGAFTVVGTVAAVVLGLVAVVSILRDRERTAGLGFAFTGVILGLAFTGLTLWSLSTGELFGFGATLRRSQMTNQLDDKVDPKTALDIKENGFTITKPVRWYRAKKDFVYLMVQPLLRSAALLLLAQPDLYAFVSVEVEPDARVGNIEDYILERLKPEAVDANQPSRGRPSGKPNANANPNDEEDQGESARIADVKRVSSTNLPAEPPVQQAYEMTVDLKLDGRSWTMLVRAYKTAGNKLFIVRGFADAAHFKAAKDDLLKIMDSFKVSPGS